MEKNGLKRRVSL